MTLKNWIWLGLCFLGAGTARAGGEGLSLDRALALARENNPEIKTAGWEREMQKAARGGAWALPEPWVSLETMEDSGTREWRVGQTLPLPLKLAARNSRARHQALRAAEDFHSMERHVLGEVKRAYIEARYGLRVLALLDQARGELEELRTGLSRRGGLGRIMPSDPLKAKAQAAELADMTLEAQEQSQAANTELGLMLGDLSVAWRPDEDPLPQDLEGNAVEMEDQAAQASPDVMREKHHILHARGALAQARSDYLPDIMLEGFEREGVAPAERGLMAGLTLPFLWSWGPASGSAVAGRELDHARAALQEAQLASRAHFRDSWIKAQKSLERLRGYDRDFLPSAEEALRVSREQYAAGRAGFMDLLDSWRMRLDFRLKRARALADYGAGLSHIEELCHKEILKTSPRKEDQP